MITFFSTISHKILIPTQNARGSRIPETVFSSLGQDTSHRETFVVFFNPSGKITGYSLKLGHGRFLLHSFNALFTTLTTAKISWLKHRP